eukprot:CAMPEP_0169203928 /NCGR_PEP_ID=MMETSP1016-20121227/11724_1 /TAXON_ID=342587 /ORGANISM="Karlodinium micrum, Strain CCMP2283" /LENGTH=477 /DNA_ID=CAMNT_0009280997 /DNA_START=60 /DNA_END=1493 /DNA_ORIENTATION=-
MEKASICPAAYDAPEHEVEIHSKYAKYCFALSDLETTEPSMRDDGPIDLMSVSLDLPERRQQDNFAALETVGLDPAGEVWEIIPSHDDRCLTLKEDTKLVMEAVVQNWTHLKLVESDVLRNDPEIALAAITQSTRACRYIGNQLKRDKKFVMAMLRKLTSLKQNQKNCSAMVDVREEPKRTRTSTRAYAFPASWPSNIDEAMFGKGEFEIPFGTDVGEESETTEVEIITTSPYAGQTKVLEGIEEIVLHDPEVLGVIFELDPVALLFEDLRRKDMISIATNTSRNSRISIATNTSRSSRPMKQNRRKIVDGWCNNYQRESHEMKRLHCWPTRFWQSNDDSQIGIGDSIHFWVEAARLTNNWSLLSEAPQHVLTNEDNMLEAIKINQEIFRITPWELRLSETFKAKLQAAFPGVFLWITLADARARMPSKARDSEMADMIASFHAVQERTGLQQHQVPFIQLNFHASSASTGLPNALK